MTTCPVPLLPMSLSSSLLTPIALALASHVLYSLLFEMPAARARDAIAWLGDPRRRRTTGTLTHVPDEPDSVPDRALSTPTLTTELGSPQARLRAIMTPRSGRPTTASRAISVPALDANGRLLGGGSPEDSPPSGRGGKGTRQALPRFEEGDGDVMSVTDSGYFGADAVGTSHERVARHAGSPRLLPDGDALMLSTHLERIQLLLERMAGERKSSLAVGHVDLDPLRTTLTGVREAVDRNSTMLKEMLQAGEEQVKRERRRSQALDLSPLSEYFSLIHNAIEQQTTNLASLLNWAGPPHGEGQTPLAEQLHRLYMAIDESNKQAIIGRAAPVLDLSRLEKSLEAARRSNDDNARQLRELLSEQTKPLQDQDIESRMDEVNEHLRSLREWSEYDSEHLKQLLHIQKTRSEETKPDQSGADRNVHKRMDRMDAQMRDLMAGQREMVDVMRQLAESISASSKGQCDHVVVPPPRKMGRKIVGFVYDTKEA